MDFLLALTLSTNLSEISGAIEKPVANCIVGMQVGALREPADGLQAQFYMKSVDPLYFKLAAGYARFAENIPTEGSQDNFALSFSLGYTIDDHWEPYIEFRHYSTGQSMFDGTKAAANPGYDRMAFGVAYKF